jgi:hypothetical protein
MSQAVKTQAREGRLTLAEVLDWLVEDGAVAPSTVGEILKAAPPARDVG